ncbi:hypothetical protein GWI33_001746 [Rhynchophorus ferrugineus]|uniref:Uncharacterized protein n=1 Tax=Rhynchophorus ferrugineus TaxID=354439 RepID=A0A834IWD6_RHYFE|nr:hypothetical protein GWI33_001746 [Rhynchophorus ferrugineus]
MFYNQSKNRLVLEGRLPLEYGANKNVHRLPVDERMIFERLWRGAFCQALGPKAPLINRRTRSCCCHCQCPSGGDEIGNHMLAQRKGLRSVVRYLKSSINYS